MRRLSGVLLAGAILVLSQGHGHLYAQAGAAQPAETQAAAAQPAAPPKTTYTGDTVLLAFSVAPDKVADYEQVLAKLKDALAKSERPEAKQQMAGWKVIKVFTPNPDGSIVFVHTINPVIKDADYSITNIVYEAVKDPAEQRAFYDLYRGAVKQALFVIQGPVVADFSK
jgi:hypothetical protein